MMRKSNFRISKLKLLWSLKKMKNYNKFMNNYQTNIQNCNLNLRIKIQIIIIIMEVNTNRNQKNKQQYLVNKINICYKNNNKINKITN